jgi:GT2 family glycosyltransferase
MMGQSITAIVLNYSTPDATARAVRSLQSSSLVPTRIIVLDNGSPDDSAGALRRTLSGIDVIESPTNLGFAAGCNLAIERALTDRPDYVLLVNSDAMLAPDALTLMHAAACEPGVGLVTPAILSAGETERIDSLGISYSRRSGRMRQIASGKSARSIAAHEPFQVDAGSGCALLIRREVFERVGLFDPDYFFFFEDVDLCLRAHGAGYSTLCVPAARAYHAGGRSIGRRSPKRVYFATRNHLKLDAGLDRMRWRRFLRAGLIVAYNAAYVVTSPDAPLFSGALALVRGISHHVRGRYGAD